MMLNRLKRRGAGGYVLVMVLMVLLVLTLLVAGLYSSAEDSRFTAQTMLAQRVAAGRAEQAAQLAIASLRVSAINPVPLLSLAPCTGPITQLRSTGSCTGGQVLTSGLVSGATGTDLEAGGGWRYQWWVYRQLSVPAQSALVFNIYAEGYFGTDDTSPNFTVAAVAAEMNLPGANVGPPEFAGDYGAIR